MKAKQAKEILIEHQLWRKGLPPYDQAGIEPPYTPKELSDAILFAIQILENLHGDN
jgi:hypothetical protein